MDSTQQNKKIRRKNHVSWRGKSSLPYFYIWRQRQSGQPKENKSIKHLCASWKLDFYFCTNHILFQIQFNLHSSKATIVRKNLQHKQQTKKVFFKNENALKICYTNYFYKLSIFHIWWVCSDGVVLKNSCFTLVIGEAIFDACKRP